MEQTDVKRRLSSASEDTRRQNVPKRMKSVDELENRMKYMDSLEESLSRSSSVDMQSLSRTTSVLTGESETESDSEQNSERSDHNCDRNMTAEERRAEYLPTYSEAIEMTSQPVDNGMFDESACFRESEEDNDSSSRCKLLKRISRSILSLDEEQVENYDECDGGNVCDVLAYMQQVRPETQTEIAHYLSSGSLEHVKLTMDNIHNFYHVAAVLRLKQLREHCVTFCKQSNQVELLAKFEGCMCHEEIHTESSSGYQRSHSIISNPDDNDPPQYYIAFSQKLTKDESQKRKSKVVVIDMSKRRIVYSHEVEKLRSFGEGFRCCSFEVKGTPFIAVSGGDGKSSNLTMKYDIILGRWEKCAKMLHGRSHHMMLSAGNGSLFVLGGSETSCIEQYDVKSNKWFERASLETHVVSSACEVYKNKIYVFGGKTPAGMVSITQSYDVENHVIERLQDLPCAFDGGRAAVLKDKIYIATFQGHMVEFNTDTGDSTLCTQQPIPRKQFGVFAKSDRIYLVGGVPCNEDCAEHTPQYRYNPEKDLWVEKRSMSNRFPVFTSCAISFEKKCCIIPFDESF